LKSAAVPLKGAGFIVTNAGGWDLAADACAGVGLDVVEFSEATRAVLRPLLSDLVAVPNPVDLVASAGPDDYERVTRSVVVADEVDAVMVLYTSVDASMTEAALAGISRAEASQPAGHGKAGSSLRDGCRRRSSVQAEQLPLFELPENAARAPGKAAAYASAPAARGTHWRFTISIQRRQADGAWRGSPRQRLADVRRNAAGARSVWHCLFRLS
jgi:acyl-CoA synthetase (NDP forming)